MRSELCGKALTVLGPVDADSLGVTLPHEHILTNVVPLMRHKGITEEQIHTILEENPGHILAFTR